MKNIKRVLIRGFQLLGYFLTQTRLGRVLVFVSLPIALLLFLFWPPDYEPPFLMRRCITTKNRGIGFQLTQC